ncbi:EthD family reductase [Nocardioides bruguierae]|uniref:EthD family reductase n=1 Tax=Nocardioides bruguierae TaxID=2945102 RepID=UPI0020225CD8|nr:EthD family reductase [Nocardioides bruguierae]MCL8023946.1 EthD family reductase [Nocardioides bruguierae]
MYTIVILTRPMAGMGREDFLEHYRTTHYDLATKIPGLLYYQQAEVAHGAEGWGVGDEAFPTHVGLSTYTFASREDAEAGFASAEGVAVDADTGTFMDWPSVLFAPATVIQSFGSPV